MKAKEELSTALEKAQEEARQQQETLAIQVSNRVTLVFKNFVLLQIKEYISYLNQILCISTCAKFPF